jgi:hypothetical protein
VGFIYSLAIMKKDEPNMATIGSAACEGFTSKFILI